MSSNNSTITTIDKYCVRIYCRPEGGCEQSKSINGEPCTNQYAVFAGNEQEAIEGAFRRHVCHCQGHPGVCEVTAEAAIVSENIVD